MTATFPRLSILFYAGYFYSIVFFFILHVGFGTTTSFEFSGEIKGQSKRTFEDAKCSCCTTVVQELLYALEKERPSQNLDLLTRLDSHGQRQGKVVVSI